MPVASDSSIGFDSSYNSDSVVLLNFPLGSDLTCWVGSPVASDLSIAFERSFSSKYLVLVPFSHTGFDYSFGSDSPVYFDLPA